MELSFYSTPIPALPDPPVQPPHTPTSPPLSPFPGPSASPPPPLTRAGYRLVPAAETTLQRLGGVEIGRGQAGLAGERHHGAQLSDARVVPGERAAVLGHVTQVRTVCQGGGDRSAEWRDAAGPVLDQRRRTDGTR